MYRAILISLSFLFCLHAQSQEITWQEPIEVATYELADPVKFSIPPRPRVAVTEAGTVNIIWAALSGFNADCAFARMSSGESSFSEPTILNGEEQILANGYGPNIAAKGDRIFVVYKKSSFGNQDVVSRRSANEGLSWESEAAVDEFLNGTFASRANVAIDGEGDPHVSVVRNVGTVKDIGELCSVNGGVSYTLFVEADNDVPGTFASAPSIAIDGTNHVVLWTQLDVSEVYKVYAALSTNDGANFSAPIDISGLEQYGAWINLEEPEAILEGNNLHVVWPSIEAANVIRYANCSIDGGISTNFTSVISLGDGNDNPTLAAGSGLLASVWQRTIGDNTELMWSYGVDELEESSEMVLFDDAINLNSPHLVYEDGFHLTYVDAENQKIMYLFGEVDEASFLGDEDSRNLKIYPNPANDILRIDHSEFNQAQYSIFNDLGQIVKRGVYNSGREVNIENLDRGVYFLLLVDEDKVYKSEFIAE